MIADGSSFVEPEFIINPWRQARKGDAKVKPSDILMARLVSFYPRRDPNDWLEVYAHDGRELTTELVKNQPNVYALVRRLQDAGVKVQLGRRLV